MPTRRMSQPKRLHTDKLLTDYSIWTLAYCQADMPYDFFGGSGLIPGHDPQVWHRHKTWTVGPNEVAEITLAKGQRSKKR